VPYCRGHITVDSGHPPAQRSVGRSTPGWTATRSALVARPEPALHGPEHAAPARSDQTLESPQCVPDWHMPLSHPPRRKLKIDTLQDSKSSRCPLSQSAGLAGGGPAVSHVFLPDESEPRRAAACVWISGWVTPSAIATSRAVPLRTRGLVHPHHAVVLAPGRPTPATRCRSRRPPQTRGQLSAVLQPPAPRGRCSRPRPRLHHCYPDRTQTTFDRLGPLAVPGRHDKLHRPVVAPSEAACERQGQPTGVAPLLT
jgi:hypothetical protein